MLMGRLHAVMLYEGSGCSSCKPQSQSHSGHACTSSFAICVPTEFSVFDVQHGAHHGLVWLREFGDVHVLHSSWSVSECYCVLLQQTCTQPSARCLGPVLPTRNALKGNPILHVPPHSQSYTKHRV